MPRLVVNLVTESGSVDNGQGDAGAFLVQLKLCPGVVSNHGPIGAGVGRHTNGDGLDADTLLEVGIGCVVGILALQNLLATEGVHKGCTP